MAMWGFGRVDADMGSIIDAILGIPAYTIRMAGVHGLPDDYMMQISARGSAYKPDIDWLRCSTRLPFRTAELEVSPLYIGTVPSIQAMLSITVRDLVCHH
jgi:hypothetical protein